MDVGQVVGVMGVGRVGGPASGGGKVVGVMDVGQVGEAVWRGTSGACGGVAGNVGCVWWCGGEERRVRVVVWQRPMHVVCVGVRRRGCEAIVANVISPTEHMMSPTEHMMSPTDHVMSPTEHVVEPKE
jgi:hypothetical protein